jgi:asparagine synthetase B (glutamine-hydrolysing)
MNAINNIGLPRNHLVGWLAITASNHRNEIGNHIDRGLNAFVGDYGLLKSIQTKDGFGFGIRQPDTPLPLTTWSFFSDEDGICFVEGVFYDRYFSHDPIERQDRQLAKLVLKNFRDRQTKAIEELSGSFSGFVFEYKDKRLSTFVDRLGTRILYWSNEKDGIIVSSNLAAFRALKTLQLDETAAFQNLTIGFPIGERTLLKNIKIQLPASINVFRGGAKESLRYWNVPKRLTGTSLKESCAMIAHSMEEFVGRIHNRTQKIMGLGLSGGHDSRVILSALAHRRIPFEPVIRLDDGFNDKVALALCSIVKTEPRIVKPVSGNKLIEIRKSSFLYSDGYYYDPVGFSILAKECYERQIKYLMLGFTGDIISGDLTIPAPQNLRSIQQLAQCALKEQLELLSFNDAFNLMNTDKNLNPHMIEQIISEWAQSFGEHDKHGHLLEVAIWQSLANRNLKRVRFAMIPAAQYAQIIFPYLDNRVLDTYFSLPIESLYHQKAHCYAGFYRFKEFGNYRACPYPVSLKNEARFPLMLYLMRLSKLRTATFLSRFVSPNYKDGASQNQKGICDEIRQSFLFDSRSFYKLLERGKTSPRDLRRLRNLVRFHNFYVCGKDHDLGENLMT